MLSLCKGHCHEYLGILIWQVIDTHINLLRSHKFKYTWIAEKEEKAQLMSRLGTLTCCHKLHIVFGSPTWTVASNCPTYTQTLPL